MITPVHNSLRGFHRRPSNQPFLPRPLPIITPEDEVRVEEMLKAAASRSATEAAVQAAGKVHPALAVLEDAGIQFRPGEVRLKVNEVPQETLSALKSLEFPPAFVNPARTQAERRDSKNVANSHQPRKNWETRDAWTAEEDRQILHEYTQLRMTYREIALSHDRSYKSVVKRLKQLCPSYHF